MLLKIQDTFFFFDFYLQTVSGKRILLRRNWKIVTLQIGKLWKTFFSKFHLLSKFCFLLWIFWKIEHFCKVQKSFGFVSIVAEMYVQWLVTLTVSSLKIAFSKYQEKHEVVINSRFLWCFLHYFWWKCLVKNQNFLNFSVMLRKTMPFLTFFPNRKRFWTKKRIL